MLEKTEGRRRGQQRIRWLDGVTDGHELGQALRGGDGQGSPVCCVHGVAKCWIPLGH